MLLVQMEPQIAHFISCHLSRTMAITIAGNICRSQVRSEYTNNSPALELHQILNYSSRVISSRDEVLFVLAFFCVKDTVLSHVKLTWESPSTRSTVRAGRSIAYPVIYQHRLMFEKRLLLAEYDTEA
jgi:hypothetical protein